MRLCRPVEVVPERGGETPDLRFQPLDPRLELYRAIR